MVKLAFIVMALMLSGCSESEELMTSDTMAAGQADNLESPAPESGDEGGESGQDSNTDTEPTNPDVEVSDGAIGSYALVNAYPNLDFPSAIFAAGVPGDSRMVVVGQSGIISAFENDENTLDSQEVLDISDRVEFVGEQGLLGLAFDPDFELNRHVYLYYSMNPPRRSVISRMNWSETEDQIDPATELVLMEVNQPFSNHNAGMLAFGPDGYLYIALGDGGGSDPDNNGQNRNTLLGSLLRIDVSAASATEPYRIPADNPFVSDPDTRPEIFALGFRNPWRFSFDRDNGELWLADVGQSSWEEVNLVESGGNYGWKFYEGDAIYNDSGNTLPPSAFTGPVLAYGRDEGYSITGGYVYRGQSLPRLNGHYLYADFGSGTVWALRRAEEGIENTAIATAANPTSFAETNDGEVLVVTIGSGVYRLIATDQ